MVAAVSAGQESMMAVAAVGQSPTGSLRNSTIRVLGAEALRQWRLGQKKSARFFVMRALLAPRAIARWITYIEKHHKLLGTGQLGTATVNKPLRSYLVRGMSAGERVRVLLDHYGLADRLLSQSLRALLARNGALTLGVLQGNRGDYAIRLSNSEHMQTTREGELVLFMEKCSDGCVLGKITFVFVTEPDGHCTIAVGGFQGVTGGGKGDRDAKSEIVDATRSLSNLRPKDVLFHAVQSLAMHIGARTIHAVSNHRHAVRKIRTGEVRADYDRYWSDKPGGPSEPFGYRLSVDLPTQAPGNKRETYKASVTVMVGAMTDRDNRSVPALCAA